MNDRDSLEELYSIMYNYSSEFGLSMTSSALSYIRTKFNMGYDIYFRRRLSVCRTLIDFHLVLDNNFLDVILIATLANHMPGDLIPPELDEVFAKIYESEPQVNEILLYLRHPDYSDNNYYQTLINKPFPLIIRLTERSVLLEKLYEWEPEAALGYLRNTREKFFPMCISAKELYPQYISTFNILYEKMRNLASVNEILLSRFVETETAIRDEILSLKEENAVVRAMISELTEQLHILINQNRAK